MKKEYVRRIELFFTMICVLFLVSSCSKYSSGKDTVLSVGDGRFQVLHGAAFREVDGVYISEGNEYILYDSENDLFQRKVKEYYDDKKAKRLYLIGEAGYSVIDYKTGRYEEHKKAEDCKQEDQAVFQDESKFTAFEEQ